MLSTLAIEIEGSTQSIALLEFNSFFFFVKPMLPSLIKCLS